MSDYDRKWFIKALVAGGFGYLLGEGLFQLLYYFLQDYKKIVPLLELFPPAGIILGFGIILYIYDDQKLDK